jgi:hypothetical protein
MTVNLNRPAWYMWNHMLHVGTESRIDAGFTRSDLTWVAINGSQRGDNEPVDIVFRWRDRPSAP